VNGMAMPKPKDCYNTIFIYSEEPATIQKAINVMQLFDSTQETLDILVY
jgi:hypothetical protein